MTMNLAHTAPDTALCRSCCHYSHSCYLLCAMNPLGPTDGHCHPALVEGVSEKCVKCCCVFGTLRGYGRMADCSWPTVENLSCFRLRRSPMP
jgi:hypothetical protein